MAPGPPIDSATAVAVALCERAVALFLRKGRLDVRGEPRIEPPGRLVSHDEANPAAADGLFPGVVVEEREAAGRRRVRPDVLVEKFDTALALGEEVVEDGAARPRCGETRQ